MHICFVVKKCSRVTLMHQGFHTIIWLVAVRAQTFSRVRVSFHIGLIINQALIYWNFTLVLGWQRGARNFRRGNFCRRNYRRRKFHPMEFSPNRIFAERKLRRREFSPNGNFAVGFFVERKFRQTEVSAKS